MTGIVLALGVGPRRVVGALGTACLLAAAAVAQGSGAEKGAPSRPAVAPTDAYAKKLKDAKLVEGVGFPGVVEVGKSFGVVEAAFGPGTTTVADPYPMVFDAGPWKLTCVGTTDGSKLRKILQAVIVEGADAPATAKGAKVGMTRDQIEEMYADAEKFTGSIVGIERRGARIVSFIRTEKELAVEEPEDFKSGAYFAAHRTAFAFDKDHKVTRIAVVAEVDPVPAFLREAAPPTDTATVRIDASVKAPAESPAGSGKYVTPAPPAFESVETDAFKIDVPKGWTREGTTWKDPESPESVRVLIEEKDPSASLSACLEALTPMAGKNKLPDGRNELPESFASMIGADFALPFEGEDVSAGKNDLPLGCWAIAARSGVVFATVVVTRTLHPRPVGVTRDNAYLGSPDGHEMARRALRSFRLK
jgi:hypothetical protein